MPSSRLRRLWCETVVAIRLLVLTVRQWFCVPALFAIRLFACFCAAREGSNAYFFTNVLLLERL